MKIAGQNLRLNHINFLWGVIGLLLSGFALILAVISGRFAYEISLLEKPIIPLVLLLGGAGIIFLILYRLIPLTAQIRWHMAWILGVGMLMRIALLPSTPILEDDFYRYLWDGAVLTEGINPYAHAPLAVLQADRIALDIPPSLNELAQESGIVIQRINHPHLRSIYPPITQLSFAIAHWIKPWSVMAWRGVLLVLEVINLLLLFMLLKSLKVSPLWIAIYWWNPLLVKEIFNSGHMDILVFPFLFGAIWASLQRRYYAASGLLALATGVKLWPVLLLPILLRPLFRRPGELLMGLLIFVLLSGGMFLPIYFSGVHQNSGFAAYGQKWELNDAFFMLLVRITQYVLNGLHIHPGYGQMVARFLVLSFILGWIFYLSWKRPKSVRELIDRCLFAVAGLFLVSPTQFPWYYVWIIPFLALRPRISLLVFVVLLPLYYLRFYFSAHGNVEIFDLRIVWLEYLPVWVLLLREWYLSHKGISGVVSEVTT